MGEENFSRLHYCFAAGYSFPQYCVDKGIRRPLFVLNKSSEWFLREVHAQFQYDRRLTAHFCFVDGDDDGEVISIGERILGTVLRVKGPSAMNNDRFDKIIFLTKETPDISSDNIIPFVDLEKFFVQRTYVDIPLLNFLQRHPKVKMILTTNFPRIERYRGGAAFGLKLWNAVKLRRALIEDEDDEIKTPFDDLGYTNEEVIELITTDKSKLNPDGTTSLIDDDNPLKQIVNGKRKTAYQPATYRNKIYFFGPCHYFGRNAPFDKTIESYLQKIINENNLPYLVENNGQAFSERTQDMFYNLNALNPEPDDIIFFHVWRMRSNNDVIPLLDISDAFDPPYDYREIFCTRNHVNERGYEALAKKYFNYLKKNNFFRDIEFKYPAPPVPYFHRYGIPPQHEQGGSESFTYADLREELDAYKQTLREKKLPVGAIVMNCNPFTFGHRALVEYAAAQVVKLYVFVVEEDKSIFPFADRIELVKQGVKDLANVEVLPSGKFIISQRTFSGYFSKEELQDAVVDSSEDVEIFGREIAPTLGITVRFAGEEPTDNVTRQYNETMREILPRYGVEFREIPRKEIGGEPISASSVREALKRGDFDRIKELVPPATLKYLRGLKDSRLGKDNDSSERRNENL